MPATSTGHGQAEKTPLPSPSYPRMQVLQTPVIHTHVVEKLNSTNKPIAHTPVHMYFLRRTRSQINTLMSRAPVTVSMLVCNGLYYTCLVRTQASMPVITAQQRLREELMKMHCSKRLCTSLLFDAINHIEHLQR